MERIAKPRAAWKVPPNLVEYERTRAEFSWEAVRRELDGLPDGKGLNIAHEAVDRHASGSCAAHLALRWLGKRGGVRDFTYAELRRLTNRFANVLDRLGVRQVVFRVLRGVAPESEPEKLDPKRSFRDELDLDSVDFMNFVVGLHETLGVDVPESDYGKLATIDGCVGYLAGKLGSG